MPITRDDVLRELQAKGYKGPLPEAKQVAPQNDVMSMVNQLAPMNPQVQRGGVADILSMLGGGKPVSEQGGGSDLAKLYQEQAIKKMFEDQEGYGSEGDIPQKIGGLPVKTITQKKGRYVPTYGNPTSFQFDMGDAIGDINSGSDEAEIPEENLQQEDSSDSEMTLDQLDQMKEQALAEGRDPEEVQAIYDEQASGLTQLAGDIGELDLTEEDRQYLLSQGFDQEQVDAIFQASLKRKGGNNV